MVVKNKVFRVINKYRKLLKAKEKKRLKLTGIKARGNPGYIKGNKTKNKILDFYVKNFRWPSRLSKNVYEKKLATRFENYISKVCSSHDSAFRRLVMATGRTTNNKRKHDIEGFKKEILEFLNTHGRVPATYRKNEIVKGEAKLRNRLDYYTNDKNDMTFLGKVYAVDKCHKSGIHAKYRAIINESLDVKKPLIRLV